MEVTKKMESKTKTSEISAEDQKESRPRSVSPRPTINGGFAKPAGEASYKLPSVKQLAQQFTVSKMR